ncbi:ABC transporter permease [Streptomyces sp. TLI_171]|uniref:ABC transporter permease n=1 Tax=Streptomyces sp. TLI_171 TaxID=1938859 RepID=UPI000C1917B6|nr:ABC transporter permease [Streptomyces sp. TLI_171]RKE21641.1 putative ABC transport system permease protein [Streptomyces sp. TLI_171]
MTTALTRIAVRSLYAGKTALLGAFTALALGVALMAVTLLGLAASAALPPGEDRVSLIAQLGTAGGVGVFTAGFVVASTFSYAVARRRREFGLLRLAGATRGQLRRTVLLEAALFGLLATATGGALGRAGAPLLARWLVAAELAPAGFRIGTPAWPLVTACATGPLIALAGVAVAARRAGRVRPLEALREADVDLRVMTAGRWLGALALLGGSAALTAAALLQDPADLLHRKTYTLQPMVLVSAAALLAPVLARPLLRLLTLPFTRRPRLVRAAALGGLRRTGALAAPVLLAVALAGTLVGAPGTVAAARSAEARSQVRADRIVEPGGRADALAAALRSAPGTVVSATGGVALSVLESDGTSVRAEGRMVDDPSALAAVRRLPVVAGDPAALDDDSVVLSREWGHRTVGEPVPVVLADGTRRTLRVAAVLRDGTGDQPVYVTARNAPGARTDRIEVKAGPGAERQVDEAARAYGAAVASRADWLDAHYPADDPRRVRRIAAVLGLALLYTAISLAHTAVTTTADRRRELAQLRLAGATRGRVLRLVAAETALVVAVGALLGAAVTLAALGAMQAALRLLGAPAVFALPWATPAATAALCVLIATPCATLAALRATADRPITALRRG